MKHKDEAAEQNSAIFLLFVCLLAACNTDLFL